MYPTPPLGSSTPGNAVLAPHGAVGTPPIVAGQSQTIHPGPGNRARVAPAHETPARVAWHVEAFANARKPSTGKRVTAGAVAAAALPVYFVAGAVVGLVTGPYIGARKGHERLPFAGAAVGALVGPIHGAAHNASRFLIWGAANVRRQTGRYRNLIIRTDSVQAFRRILSAIPQDRMSENALGETVVEVAPGRHVNLNWLAGFMPTLGGAGYTVRVKPGDRHGSSERSERNQLCWGQTEGSHGEIHFQSGIENTQLAGEAGVQFFDVLDHLVKIQKEDWAPALA